MRTWRRPPGYTAFVAVGIAGVVVATVASAVATSDEPGSMVPIYTGVGAVTAFVVLLLVYQWLGTALAMRGEQRTEPPASPGDPPADVLGALVIDPDAGPPPAEVQRSLRRGVVSYQALISAFALAVVLGGVASYILGLPLPVAFAPAAALLAWGVVTHRRRMRWALGVSDGLLLPLGLRVTALPRVVAGAGGDPTRLVGASVLSGRRHGRRVEIVLEARDHAVTLEGPFPRFTVRATKDGTLRPGGGTPEAVARRLDAITPARRWRGVELEAGGDALVVRRGGGSDARERWPDDLWLAEACAAAASGVAR